MTTDKQNNLINIKSNGFNKWLKEEMQYSDFELRYRRNYLKTILNAFAKEKKLNAVQLENLIELSHILKINSLQINNHLNLIFTKRYNYFLKLAALDYMISINSKFDNSTYKRLVITCSKSRNPLVKLQCYTNLLKFDFNFYFEKAIKIIDSINYPTPMYRFLNTIKFLKLNSNYKSLIAHRLNELILKKKYSMEINKEIRILIKNSLQTKK